MATCAGIIKSQVPVVGAFFDQLVNERRNAKVASITQSIIPIIKAEFEGNVEDIRAIILDSQMSESTKRNGGVVSVIKKEIHFF